VLRDNGSEKIIRERLYRRPRILRTEERKEGKGKLVSWKKSE